MGEKPKVVIYTDGACSGNPGPGGWGVILQSGQHRKELKGGEANTTNNRMELTGVREALSALREDCRVTLYTDSAYIADAFKKDWIHDWRRRGWKRKEGELKNADLWQALSDLTDRHEVTFVWVKGHAENEYNNRCDALAVARSREQPSRRAD